MKKYYMKLYILAKNQTKQKNKEKKNSTTVFVEYKNILQEKKNNGELSSREYDDAIKAIIYSPFFIHKVNVSEGVD